MNDGKQNNQEKKIELLKEELKVDKIEKITGRIVLDKTVETIDVNEKIDLTSNTYNIERVQKNKLVDEVPEIQYLDDVTIIPVVKEVIVKRIKLVEEIHIHKLTETREEDINETLREEKVSISRFKH